MQAALATGQARREAAQERLSGAKAAQTQMRQDIGDLRAEVERALRECRAWADRHADVIQRLCASTPQELSLPTEYWLSTASKAPLGMPCTKHLSNGAWHEWLSAFTSLFFAAGAMSN